MIITQNKYLTICTYCHPRTLCVLSIWSDCRNDTRRAGKTIGHEETWRTFSSGEKHACWPGTWSLGQRPRTCLPDCPQWTPEAGGRRFGQLGFAVLWLTHSFLTARQLFTGFLHFSMLFFNFLRPEHDCYNNFSSCSTSTSRNIKKTFWKHLIKIINLGAKNCPVGRNGLKSKE